jgi:probable HAF family extracellular repeat protein
MNTRFSNVNRIFSSKRIGRSAFAFALVAGAALSASAQTYTVTDLGTLGKSSNGSYSEGDCINDGGEIGGSSTSSSKTITDPAFLYREGVMTSIGTLGGEYGVATGINASGQLAGYSTLADGTYGAFLYTGGKMMNLGTLGSDYSIASAVNDAGEVVGVSALASNDQHAFLYRNGKMTDLGTLGMAPSTATGINRKGVIVGFSYNAAGDFLGFIYRKDHMSAMGTLGGTWSIAYAINNRDQITGVGYTKNNLYAHAFRYTNGKMVDLGGLGGASSYTFGTAINDSGTVVGRATTSDDVYHAFISTNGGHVQDLNGMIPVGSGWVLGEATGINNSGQITGWGTINGETHAFLLTPAQ